MAWNFTADKPVYLQIADRIIKSILSGEYQLGAQIPAVRQLALEAAVNPNTVQHAFTELEHEGIIISRGTLGRYVTEDADVVAICRKKIAQQYVTNFVENMNQLSIDKEEMITMIEEAMK